MQLLLRDHGSGRQHLLVRSCDFGCENLHDDVLQLLLQFANFGKKCFLLSVNHDSRWGIISANFEDVLDLTNRFSGCFGFNDLVNGLLEDSTVMTMVVACAKGGIANE